MMFTSRPSDDGSPTPSSRATFLIHRFRKRTVWNERAFMRLVAVAFLVGCALPSHAVTPPKGGAPWEWADEERLATRLNPAGVRDRIRLHEAGRSTRRSRPTARESSRSEVLPVDYVMGSENPELLFPGELLHQLTEMLNSPEAPHAHYHEMTLGHARDYGLPDNTAELFSASTAGLVALDAPPPRHTTEPSITKAADDPTAICREIRKSLDTLQSSLGQKQFSALLRLFYEHVAPLVSSVKWGNDGEDAVIRATRLQSGLCK